MLNRPLPPGRRAPRSAIIKCAPSTDEASALSSQDTQTPCDKETDDGDMDNLESGRTMQELCMEDRHVSVADVHEATPRDEVVIVAASSDVEAPAAVACVVPSDNYHVVAACNEDVATEPPALPVVATRPTAATVEVDSSPASPSCDTPIERVPSVQTHMASPDDVEWYGLDRVTRPWTVVPELPPVESLECVYNDDARGLQKRILRAVKWCTNADKVKLDEFKINSRLFGNGFMDPDEYTQSMAHELGPLNMLVIIPCMLRLQPDPLKKQLLYMALQSYRTKSMATLEALVVRG